MTIVGSEETNSYIQIRITTDNWPEETGWELRDANGSLIENVNVGDLAVLQTLNSFGMSVCLNWAATPSPCTIPTAMACCFSVGQLRRHGWHLQHERRCAGRYRLEYMGSSQIEFAEVTGSRGNGRFKRERGFFGHVHQRVPEPNSWFGFFGIHHCQGRHGHRGGLQPRW